MNPSLLDEARAKPDARELAQKTYEARQAYCAASVCFLDFFKKIDLRTATQSVGCLRLQQIQSWREFSEFAPSAVQLAMQLAAQLAVGLRERRLPWANDLGRLRRQHLLSDFVDVNHTTTTSLDHAGENGEADESDTRNHEAVGDRSRTGLRIRARILHALAESVRATTVASGHRAGVRHHALVQRVRLRLPAAREGILEDGALSASRCQAASGFSSWVVHSPAA